MGVRLPPFAPSPTWRRELVVLTAIAAATRTIWALLPGPLTGDEIEYWQLATTLARTGRYSYDGLTATSSRPPLYPALVATLMRLTDHPHAALLAVQVILGSLTVALAASLAHRAFGRTTALITGVAFALAPISAQFSAVVLSETLFTMLMVLSMWWWQGDRAVASGITLGLAALTRPIAQPFVLVLAIAGLLFRKTRLQRQCVQIAVVAALTTTPWIIRNVMETGKATISDGSWGATLAYGTVRIRVGTNRETQVARALGYESPAPAGARAVEGQRAAIEFFLRTIATNPAGWLRARVSQYPWLFLDTGDSLPLRVNNTSFFQAWRQRTFAPIILKLSFLASEVIVLALAVYGGWSARQRAAGLLPLWAWLAFVLAVQLPAYAESRFGIPLMPFVFVFAAAGLARLSVYAGEIPQ